MRKIGKQLITIELIDNYCAWLAGCEKSEKTIQKYRYHLIQFMKYLDEKVLDHVNGSWFHQLDRENNLLETVWPGKSDIYHALQATLIPYYAPGLSIAVAVKKQAR